MYEYTFVRIPSPPTLNTMLNVEERVESYLDYCRQVIIDHAKNGWRLAKILQPIEGHFMSELIFERPAQKGV